MKHIKRQFCKKIGFSLKGGLTTFFYSDFTLLLRIEKQNKENTKTYRLPKKEPDSNCKGQKRPLEDKHSTRQRPVGPKKTATCSFDF